MPRFTIIEAGTGFATTYFRHSVEAPTAAEALKIVREGESYGVLWDTEQNDSDATGHGIAEPALFIHDVCRRADQDLSPCVGERDADQWAEALDAEAPCVHQSAWTGWDHEAAAARGWILFWDEEDGCIVVRQKVEGVEIFDSHAAAAKHVETMSKSGDALSAWAMHVLELERLAASAATAG